MKSMPVVALTHALGWVDRWPEYNHCNLSVITLSVLEFCPRSAGNLLVLGL